MPYTSALPDVYYAIFRYFEPLLTAIGLVQTFRDPKAFHDQQAPWPSGTAPPKALPIATVVTTLQLAHVCALLGLLNYFTLGAIRKHLQHDPALQERVCAAFLLPLLIGDFGHLFVTVWALGEHKWNFAIWTPINWVTVVLGIVLLIPRLTWHLGIGRYVHARDGQALKARKGKAK